MTDIVIVIIVAIAIIIIILFFIFRELLCWYWKINEVVSLMNQQNDLLRKILAKSDPEENVNNIEPKIIEKVKKVEQEIIVPKYSETEIGSESSLIGGAQIKFNIKFEDGVVGEIYKKVDPELYKIICKKTHAYYSTKESAINALYIFIKSGKIIELNRTYL